MLKVIKRKKLMICVCIIPLLWRNIGCSCLSKDSVTLVKYFFYLFTENEKRCLQYSQSWTISSKIIRNNSEFLLFWTMIIKVYPRFFLKKPSKQKCYIHKHVNVNIYQMIFAHNTIAICQKKLYFDIFRSHESKAWVSFFDQNFSVVVNVVLKLF